MNDYLINLKNKYNYSDQVIQMLNNIINAFINVMGEEYSQIILNAIEKTFIFQFDNSLNATNTLNQLINDGTNHTVSVKGAGFMEDYYTYNNGEINQHFAIGISTSSKNGLSTLIHELCHVISTYNKLKFEDNKVVIRSGFNFTSHQLVDGKISNKISNTGEIFNEMVTENLAMQVMDTLEPDIIHEPTAYNGYVNDFKGIFRNESLNKVIIGDYINNSSNFLSILESVISKEQIYEEVNNLYNSIDLKNDNIVKYLEYIKSLSVKDFFLLYIEYCNRFRNAPEGIDKATFREMKNINSEIVYNLSQKIMEDKYSK